MLLTTESIRTETVGQVRELSELTVLVPAYNEAASIADTIRSLQAQSLLPAEIIVVDDCSTDATGEIARHCGARVVRPPGNTGSKAGAQNFALGLVRTKLTMALDADTILAPDAIEKLLVAFVEPRVVAACGFVLPRYVRTLWERGRYIEYMLAFTWYKPIQDYYGKPLISSGCFSAYRTDILNAHGGWSTRTMAEDMDLTWSFYESGNQVRFIPAAVCYPLEPEDFNFMSKQLRRWSHGFIQNVMLHWRGVLRVPYLRGMVSVALWDAVVASFAYILLLPVLALVFGPLVLLLYFIDIPVVVIPTLLTAWRRGETWRVLGSLHAFFVLRLVNSVFILRALWSEVVIRRPLRVYEKGH
jgi:poly-beta-1,6-N-acetyl-D-glucosamine synthase